LAMADSGVKFTDFSGIVVSEGENPFDVFIKACNDDPVSRFGLLFR
jgi:hypothetical protein